MDRTPVDLVPALKDAYLRKVAFTKGCETVELTFHVLRRALGSREREQDRVAGFRFRGVRGLATEALRWDRDAAKWVQAKVDWLGALARDQMERPIVNGASVGLDVTLERWRKAAESALWLRGQPANLDPEVQGIVAVAPVIFELTAEVILPSGINANARLFLAADGLDVVGSKGPRDLGALLREGEDWTAKWRDYWRRRERRPELPEDPQFEWMQPTEDDLR
ncbi:MAG TPA: hypothetical protein VHF22_14830 [Planctomycetota bacterium]|nr:hypothetical protein [Planctomycetota bacterium]